MEQSQILQRMSVFGDSKFLARAIREHDDDYLCAEVSTHINGLWAYCGDLASEIKRLQKLLKESAIAPEVIPVTPRYNLNKQ